MPNWRVEITPHAERDLWRLTVDMRRWVLDALTDLTADPPTGDIKKLSGGQGEFRLRVGDWRVIFRRDDANRVVVVLSVEHRSHAYRH